MSNDPVGAHAAAGIAMIACKPCKAGSKLDKIFDNLPSIDGTGKMHGELPDIKDLKKLDKETLRDFRDDLKSSMEKRTEVTKDLGSDAGHSRREAAESDLIKSLHKF